MRWTNNLSFWLLEPNIFHEIPSKNPDFPRKFLVFPLIFLDKMENLSGKTIFFFYKTLKTQNYQSSSPYFPRFFPFSFLFIPFHSSAWRKKTFSAMSISFLPIFASSFKTRWLPIRRVANHKVGNDGTRKDGRETSSNVIVPERLI